MTLTHGALPTEIVLYSRYVIHHFGKIVILTSHMFVTPYWRSNQLLSDMLSYGAEIFKVFI